MTIFYYKNICVYRHLWIHLHQPNKLQRKYSAFVWITNNVKLKKLTTMEETNIKCFIDGLKPTDEMNEKELRNFSDAARSEIKRLIDMQHRAAEEYNALKSQLAQANEKLATVTAERDNCTNEICDLCETIRRNEENIENLQKQLDIANKNVESEKRLRIQEFRKCEILKVALNLLKEKYSIGKGDFYSALLSGVNGELDIDTLLYQLSK